MNVESHYVKGACKAMNFVTDALMAVPNTFQEGKLGVLEAVNKTGGGYYTEEELTIPETLDCSQQLPSAIWPRTLPTLPNRARLTLAIPS